jgi:hypothetical protein
MANGDYISKLVKGVREDLAPAVEEEKILFDPLGEIAEEKDSPNIHDLIEAMRNFEVKGESKRLIRMDAKNEEVLKLLSPTFGVDVTSFVNFLCRDFLENNPALVNEIKQSIQKL